MGFRSWRKNRKGGSAFYAIRPPAGRFPPLDLELVEYMLLTQIGGGTGR
jgi:hypothetical protein